jgi:hypothetical protein
MMNPQQYLLPRTLSSNELSDGTSDSSDLEMSSNTLPTNADQKWKQIRLRVLKQIDESSADSEHYINRYNQLDQMLSCNETLVLPPHSKSHNKENVRSEEQHDVSRILATLKRAAVPDKLFSPARHSNGIFSNTTNIPSSYGDPSSKRAKITTTKKINRTRSDDKENGLHGLCKRFIQTYSTDEYKFISVDDAARLLQVERRRVYDVVNILECLDIVVRECKNTYCWKGMDQLPTLLGRWQAEAINLWPNEAKSNGLEIMENRRVPVPNLTTRSGRILVLFLQRFLIGEVDCCLSDECDKIFTALPFEKPIEGSKEADLKTKAKSNQRRLYDIANVLMSLNIIQKSGNRGKNAIFQWSYHLTTQDIQLRWKNLFSLPERQI